MKQHKLHTTSIRRAVKNQRLNFFNIINKNDIEFWNGAETIDAFKKLAEQTIQIKQWKQVHTLKLFPSKTMAWQASLNITDENFFKLASTITMAFLHLKDLSLEFYNWGAIADKSLEQFGVQIGRRLVHLQHLCLKFKFCGKITDQGITRLAQEISRNLFKLTDLNLRFRLLHLKQITDKGLQIVSSEIARHLVNLKHLHLGIREQKGVSPKGIEHFTSIISSKLTKIQTLRFCFTHKVVSDQCLRTLLDLICTNLPALKHLRFTLGYLDNVPTKSLWFILAKITRHLVHLEYLDFNFSNSIDAKLEGHDAYNLNQLPSLKSLMLRISGVAASERSLLQITTMIPKTFPNLESFGMKFAHENAILDNLSSKSLDSLIFGISKSLDKLHWLWIDAHSCKLTSANWKKWLEFGTTEKPVSHLKHLTLVLNGCRGATSEFLRALGGRIAFFFGSLESFAIDLRWCETNPGGFDVLFMKISERLTDLKSVKIVTSAVEDDEKESWKGLFYLVEDVQVNNEKLSFSFRTKDEDS